MDCLVLPDTEELTGASPVTPTHERAGRGRCLRPQSPSCAVGLPAVRQRLRDRDVRHAACHCDAASVEQWPRWATEQVQVEPPQETWRSSGERLSQQLDTALEQWVVAPVAHVGSTAVPGLAAKPILDLQAAVVDFECAEPIARVLGPAGWHLVPADLDARPYRRLLVLVVDGRRAAHLHLLLASGARWSEQLAFREALRADPTLVRRYAELKRTLADEHAADREAYTAGKADFVRSVVTGTSDRRRRQASR